MQHFMKVALVVVLRAASLGADAAGLRASSVLFEPGPADGMIGGAFADGPMSFLQNAAKDDQMPPPSYWAGAPTPAPPSLGPGPYPGLMWVEQKPLPLPETTPPVYEQCHGCHCMFVFPEGFTTGGNIADKYSCLGGAATHKIPHIKWVGQPGADATTPDGAPCKNCASYAVTVEDMDFPNGVGELNNVIHSIFWAVNIPGDQTEINDDNAFGDKTTTVVGLNAQGVQGLEIPCPKKGKHRYKVTLWSLSGYLGSDANPFPPSTPAGEVKAALEAQELARATFFASLTSPGYIAPPPPPGPAAAAA